VTDRREFYSLFKPGNLFLFHQRERAVLAALREAGVDRRSLSALEVLEVGCGAGGFLPSLLLYGAEPERLAGIDLDGSRIAEARRRYPGIRFATGDATALSIGDARFDMVVQSTLFTSLLDPDARRAAAREMVRVLRPGGLILWFDFRVNSPSNPNVRGIGRREIERDLFPGARCRFRSTLLVPPLARRLVPLSRFAAELLSLLPFLRTHYCAVIVPPGH
jgi:ubiquinone/menaquinone biosynthesis C-methylase UbiE